MLRAAFLGKFFKASDRELEKALQFRVDFMLFCGLSITSPKPDHATLCRFRNDLVEAKLMDALFEEINRQLTEHQLMIEENEDDLSIVDATVIKAAARPKTVETEIVEDRKEGDEVQEGVTRTEKTTCSADPDAAFLLKNGEILYGYKMISTVNGRGFIKKFFLRPANEGESPHFAELMKDDPGTKVYADKAYASKKNCQLLKDLGKEDGIMYSHKERSAH